MAENTHEGNGFIPFDLSLDFSDADPNILVLHVAGPSMRGIGILDGDQVVIDTSKTEGLADGCLAAVRFTQVRVARLNFKPDCIELCSEHPEYPPHEVRAPESIEILGVVIGLKRKL